LAVVGDLASSAVAVFNLVSPLLTRWQSWDEDPSIRGFEILGLPPVTRWNGRRLPATLRIRDDTIEHEAWSQIEWLVGHDSILRLIGALAVGALITDVLRDTIFELVTVGTVANEEHQLTILGTFQSSLAW